MTFFSRKALKTCVRLFWGTVVFLVILLAVIVQLGRTAFPYLNDYKQHIEQALSERLNAEITLGEISASWDGLRPQISLRQLVVAGGSYKGEMFVEHASAEINLLASLRDWRAALRKLQFKGSVIELRQSKNGRWAIVGLPQSSSSNDFSIDDPLDIFLFGRRITLVDTAIAFRFRTGHLAEMIIPSATLENDQDFHRLKAKLDVDDDINALYFIIEGFGDPRDEENFTSKGYLHLQNFPLQKVVAASGFDKGLDIEPDLWSEGSRVDLQLWFEGSVEKGLRFNGGGKASGLPFALPGGNLAPAIPQFKYSGRWERVAGLSAQIADFAFSWPEAKIPPLDIALNASLTAPLELRVRELDIGDWSRVAETLKLNKALEKIQSMLNPAGKLRNIGVTLLSPEQGYFNLQADVIGGAVDSWQGAPQVRGAIGFIESTALSGRMVLNATNGFSMHYPVIYKKPLSFDEAQGEVAWFVDLDAQMVHVTSGLLHLKGESGEGAGYLYLSLPTKKREGVEPEMTLAVGMRKSLAKYHDAFVPYTIPNSLYDWLGESIKEGELSDGGFIYRGSLLKKPLRPRSLQLGLNIHQGRIAFDSAWPELSRVDATILVDDLALSIAVDSGLLQGNRVTQARVALSKTAQGKLALSIQGDAVGDASNAIALLKNSPVNDIAGQALSQLDISGAYRGNVNLLIPLEGDPLAGFQDVKASLSQGVFNLPDVGLSFDDVNGDINYHSAKGLSAQHLKASLWGKSIDAELTTLLDKKGKTLKADFKGVVTSKGLSSWLNRPLFNYLEGEASVKGFLKLPFGHPDQGIELVAHSDLKGLAMDFPEPYKKEASQLSALKVQYKLPSGSGVSRITLAEKSGLQSQLLMKGGQLLGLNIGVNDEAKASRGSIHLHGHLGVVDAKQWSAFINEYLGALSVANQQEELGAAGRDNISSALPPRFSMKLKADVATFDSFVLTEMDLRGQENKEDWVFHLKTPEAIVNYQLFNNERPAVVHFEHLHLPKMEESSDYEKSDHEKKGSIITDTALENIKSMDIRIDELAFGGEGWGHVAFDYRPEPQGLIAKRIRGNLKGLKTTNATMALYKSDTDHWETSFNGLVSAVDIGDVLNALEYPRALTSNKAEFDVSLNWPGYPDQIEFDSLTGVVSIDLKKGRFVSQGGENDSGFLKLLALLNFDTLVRRLKLDFSDLHPEGLAYDRVTGRLNFHKDYVALTEENPILVDTSSADIKMVGDINLADQKIDAHLTATLPVAGNLAVAAALAAGLPAAVGVYVVGKLFEEQVDDLTRVKYRVMGGWDNPKLSVDKISDAQKRSSK